MEAEVIGVSLHTEELLKEGNSVCSPPALAFLWSHILYCGFSAEW